jgi:hypothetical protein
MSSILDFPNEVTWAVFGFMSAPYLYFVRQVCPDWRALAVALLRREKNIYRYFSAILIRDGHLELLRLVEGVIFEAGIEQLNCALRYGRLEIAEWLIGQGVKFDQYSFFRAVESLKLEAVQWVGERDRGDLNEVGSRGDLNEVGSRGDRDKNYFHMGLVGRHGTVELLEFTMKYFKLDFQKVSSLFAGAISAGNLALLDWILEKFGGVHAIGCSSGFAYYRAAEISGIKSVKWLQAHGFVINDDVLVGAVEQGNREMIEYLLGLGCGWGRSGSCIAWHDFDFMIWCLERGCPIVLEAIFHNFGKRDHLKKFDYLKARYDLSPIRENEDYTACAADSETWYLKFLVNNGFTVVDSEGCHDGIKFGSYKFLYERGLLKWNPEHLVDAARMGRIDFLRWAYTTGEILPLVNDEQIPYLYVRKWLDWKNGDFSWSK